MKVQTEFQRFDAGMRAVLSVPREELKAREEEWKRERAGKKRAKPKVSSPGPAAQAKRV